VNAFWMALAIVVCAALVYLGYRIEPHHVSKDGSRFLTSGQWLSSEGQPQGRRREVWVRVIADGQLQIDVKRHMRHDVTHWTIEGKSPEPPPRSAVYVLRTLTRTGATQRMTVKLPAKSRAVGILDEAIARRGGR
jgi:hypothetical protein